MAAWRRRRHGVWGRRGAIGLAPNASVRKTSLNRIFRRRFALHLAHSVVTKSVCIGGSFWQLSSAICIDAHFAVLLIDYTEEYISVRRMVFSIAAVKRCSWYSGKFWPLRNNCLPKSIIINQRGGLLTTVFRSFSSRAEPSLARPAKVAVTCCSASFIRHYVGGVIIGHSVVCQHLLQHTGPQFSVDLSRFRGRSRGCVAVFLRCSLSSAVAEISLVSHYSESH